MKNVLVAIIALLIVGLGIYLFTGNKKAPTAPQSIAQPSENSSKVLAGESAPFLEFNKADYEKALADNKIILLDFYANWCPICRGEAPILIEGFNSLSSDKIIGFRVNFKDSDTDKDEEKLAKDFNIPYQHTKVILKNGKEILRSTDSWTKEIFDAEIAKALTN